MDLFQQNKSQPQHPAPLADRIRPITFDEFVGQGEIIGEDKPLRKILSAKQIVPSMIFWGPPGSGKTTLAFLISNATNCDLVSFSAVTSGIKDIKNVMERATANRNISGKVTILFVDEIHRFNRAQQDAFLPYVEKGVITLIGATTENPSFEVNSALLSRCRVFVLKSLIAEEVMLIVERAAKDVERGLGKQNIKFEDGAMDFLVNISNGDARISLNLLELAASATKPD